MTFGTGIVSGIQGGIQGGINAAFGSNPILLDLDFETTSQPALLDNYSRASACAPITGVGASGVDVTKFASGEYAYVYDAAFAHASKLAMLHEPAATNLVPYSEEFDNAAWSKTGCTVNANAATAPDGTATADEVVFSGTTRVISDGFAVASGVAMTVSVFMKSAAGATSVDLVSYSDPSTKTVVACNLTTEWQRFEATVTTVDTGGEIQIETGSDKTIEVWGAQAEQNAVATSYIPTSGATASRVVTSAFVSTPIANGYLDHAAGEIRVVSVANGAQAAGYMRIQVLDNEKYMLTNSARIVDDSRVAWVTFSSPGYGGAGAETVARMLWDSAAALPGRTQYAITKYNATTKTGPSTGMTPGTTDGPLHVGAYQAGSLPFRGAISRFTIYAVAQAE